MRFYTVFDFVRPAMAASKIMVEAQVVIGLRVAGMAGFWPMGQGETDRMVSEKVQASKDAAQALIRSAIAGGSLPDMAMAVMRPVGHVTKANARRLRRKARLQ